MKILLICTFFPYPPHNGGMIRSFNLIKELSKRNEVHLMVFTPWSVDELPLFKMREYCKSIEIHAAWPTNGAMGFIDMLTSNCLNRLIYKFFPNLFFKKISLRLLHPVNLSYYGFCQESAEALVNAQKREKFDIVHFEYLSVAHYVDYISSIPAILGQQNVESEVLRQLSKYKRLPIKIGKYLFAMRMRSYERKVASKFHSVIAVSEEDKALLETLCKNVRVVVIPNGVDIDFYSAFEGKISEKPYDISFTGSLQYEPNIDAMVYFCKKIFPLVRKSLPSAKLNIVGRDPSAEVLELGKKYDGVEICANVQDIRPYIGGCSVYIVPLRCGGGTRIKILEAMAMGKSVVSTSIGCQGLDVVDGKNIIVSDEPRQFAERVVALLENKDMRMRFGEEGKRLVKEKYSWVAIAQKMEKEYHHIVSERRSKMNPIEAVIER